MIKTIIVDDEKIAQNLLKILLNKHCQNVELVGVASNVNEAFELINKHNPDLVFLDVEMPFGSGFSLLEKFEEIKFSIIFVTAYDKYAVKAFKFSAIDYLLKPIDEDELKSAVLKIKKNTSSDKDIQSIKTNIVKLSNSENKIVLRAYTGLVFVDLNTVIRLQADGNKTICFFKDQSNITVMKSLGDFEVFFDEFKLVRVHYSHIINLNHIKSYQPGRTGILTMIDGSEVEVSQRKKDDFLKRFNRF
jgi:two-component system LytT family response regulator